MNLLPAMLVATTLIGGSTNLQHINISSVDVDALQEKCYGTNIQVIAGTGSNLKDLLNKLCSNIPSIKDCIQVIIPGFGSSDDLPDTPDSEVPDSDTDTPDVEIPDNDTDTPDTEIPSDDTNTPDSEVPEDNTNTPDAENPENGTNTPGVEVPGNGSNNSGNNSGNMEGSTNLSYVEQVVALVNTERAKVNLPTLTMSEDLNRAAQIRAKETVQSFSHTRPNGSSFSSVLKENGISYRGAGENIAWGQRTPEAVVKAWMNSDGHRANILNKNYTSIGVGYYLNGSTPYWAQIFTY